MNQAKLVRMNLLLALVLIYGLAMRPNRRARHAWEAPASGPTSSSTSAARRSLLLFQVELHRQKVAARVHTPNSPEQVDLKKPRQTLFLAQARPSSRQRDRSQLSRVRLSVRCVEFNLSITCFTAGPSRAGKAARQHTADGWWFTSRNHKLSLDPFGICFTTSSLKRLGQNSKFCAGPPKRPSRSDKRVTSSDAVDISSLATPPDL